MSPYFLFFFACFVMHSLLMPIDAEEKSGSANCPELTGEVIRPDHERYNQSRLVANYYVSKNQKPDLIVYCKSTEDVQNAVKWARCHNRPIRIRSGGHNHEGFSIGAGAIVIDVSQMKQMEIDKEKSIAKLQPGITGGELYRALSKEGLTQVGGTCEDVGISGLILSGGMGPLLRRHGMSCDSLLSLEMVDAKGDVIQATAENEHKDLFWAARGGGAGNFGVLTSLVLKVYPANDVTWFNIGWGWDQPVEKIMTTWQEFFANGDKQWFSHFDIWAKPFPVDKLKKQPIKVLGVYYGPPEEVRQKLAPFLNIGKPATVAIETVHWVDAIKSFEEATSTFITETPEYKSTGAYAMEPLPPEAIHIIVDTMKNSKNPLLNVVVFSMGGAAADVAPTATAYFYRKAKYFYDYSTQWLNEKEDKNSLAELDTLRQRLLPYTEGDYIGNPDRSLKDYLKVYYGDNVQKLRCVKLKYDPENIFQYEQSIPPAEQGSCH